MEVQIQNLTSFPMCMGQVWFEASSLCTAVNLNSYHDNDGLVSDLIELHHILQGDLLEILFTMLLHCVEKVTQCLEMSST